jgi:hypothetical protein
VSGPEEPRPPAVQVGPASPAGPLPRGRGAPPAHPSGWTPVRRSPFPQRVLLFSAVLGVSGFFGFSALRQLQPSVPSVDIPAWAPSVALAAQTPAPPPAVPVPVPTAPVGDAGVADGPLPDIVKITFQTIPPVKADVYWGKKKLGVINAGRRPTIKPLIVERPRDSGPMDLMVTAEGFLPVHTRAYTFTDGKLNIKLTLLTEKHTLLGFKQALPDAGTDGGVADAGVPPPQPPAVYGPAPQPPPPPPPVP